MLVITELMAKNEFTLDDEDGDEPDWIEIGNIGDEPGQLEGCFLTDDANDLTKWMFPAVSIDPGEYLLVFASDKNRTDPNGPLHTNFKLDDNGEYLALVAPDGETIYSTFDPTFPVIPRDISFGLGYQGVEQTYGELGEPLSYVVPTDDGYDSIDPDTPASWTLPDYDASAWGTDLAGAGYVQDTESPIYGRLGGDSLETEMLGLATSAYVRLSFTIDHPDAVESLYLDLGFSDGVVVYLNGEEVLRDNAPLEDIPAWDWTATASRSDEQAVQYETFDLSTLIGDLESGQNVLAVHGFSAGTTDTSFFVHPELRITHKVVDPAVQQYFLEPTPGGANPKGQQSLGPLFLETSYSPHIPQQTDPIVVVASLTETFFPIDTTGIELHYRVMFDGEVTVAMADDGLGDDLAAGDGLFTGTIPGGIAAPGQMIRWYLTALDTESVETRYPYYDDTLIEMPQYFGTVVEDPSLQTDLPVLHWFVENTSMADQRIGTRCSIMYDGEFYDNIFVRSRGGSTTTLPKQSHKFDMNPGYKFSYGEGIDRVEEFNVNTTYSDKTYIRRILSWQVCQEAGLLACNAFPIRIQQNGVFYSVDVFVENVDDDFLERNDLNADDGAELYKIFNGLSIPTIPNEKKIPDDGDITPLYQLMGQLSWTGSALQAFLYDNIDLPNLINYMAAMVVIGDTDYLYKNHFLYRDLNDTGQWKIIPWDKDLTFGRTWGGDEYWLRNERIRYDNSPFIDYNNLLNVVLEDPTLRSAYLRRIRTLADCFLQESSVPREERYYETQLDAYYDLMAADTALDYTRWAVYYTDYFGDPVPDPPGWDYGFNHDFAEALAAVENNYLPYRRAYLYGLSEMPPAQTPADYLLNFGSIEFNPASGNQDEEYIVIANTGTTAVDLSDWSLVGGVELDFAPGTVLAAGQSLYLVADWNAFHDRTSGPSGGQGLFVAGQYSGHLSNFGELLELYSAGGSLVASVTTPVETSPQQDYLRITELMFDPAPATSDEIAAGYSNNDDFEYVELFNASPDTALDLSGVTFTDGIEYTFAAGTELGSGEYMVVPRNLAAFQFRYGIEAATTPDEYGLPDGSNKFANGGEQVKLDDPSGSTITNFTYEPDGNSGWPVAGDGSALELYSPALDGSQPEDWYAIPAGTERPGFLAAATIAGRFVFYNDSAFDTQADADALAIDKSAWQAGDAPADWSNVSNYEKGLNGLFIDIAHLPPDATPSADDFVFRFGNDNDPAGWLEVSGTPTVQVVPGGGALGTDRIVLIWPNDTIVNTWLEVTVSSATSIGLLDNDVFYFGHWLGETGNQLSRIHVDVADLIRIRNHAGDGSVVYIDNPYDINRDAQIDAIDQILARNHVTLPWETLQVLDFPPEPSPQAEGQPDVSPVAFVPVPLALGQGRPHNRSFRWNKAAIDQTSWIWKDWESEFLLCFNPLFYRI